jgi:hypothetical protein
MVGGADAGQPGAHHQHINVFTAHAVSYCWERGRARNRPSRSK